MKPYLVLLRGINVGGRNKIPMAELRARLADLGFGGVSTYIASGNVVLRSAEPAARVRERIEAALLDGFTLDDELIKALVLDREQLRVVIDDRPEGFGARPDKCHSDAIFLLDISVEDAMTAFSPREGVDEIWPGPGVIYSQRLSAERTKSRLSKITSSPLYKSMTIRSWATTLKLWDMIREPDEEEHAEAR
jgi:uncharacterized protein (DUF1697 family)